ncbi:MAG: ABC transporter permease [Deltaproteobacteria bacterium]|nr:ABC transporter permease [Deltaproteobacteria bacterium]
MRFFKIALKNTLRHKLRTGLTVFGIAVAVLAFCLLRTVIHAWYAGVEASAANRLITRNATSLIFPLPLSYLTKIKQISGVTGVTYANWFGGIYIDEKNFFPQFAIEARSFFNLYPEIAIPEKELSTFLRERKACIAGRKLVNKYHWKIGEIIPLRGVIFPGNWEFVLRGVYHGTRQIVDESQFFFHWDYLNEQVKAVSPTRANQVGWYVIQLADPFNGPEIAQTIDRLFKNSLAETLTETEKAFQLGFIAMTEAIIVSIKVISLVVIFIIMIVLANTMAMTARERVAEYAVLKTLGFGGWTLFELITGESLLIALAGGVLGIGLTFPTVRVVARQLEMFFPVFRIHPATLWMALGASALVGLVAALFPVYRAVNIRIAEGLRGVD